MRAGYWLGGLLILAGVVTAVAVVVLRVMAIGDAIDGYPKASLGEGSVQLQARDYNVYLDAPSGVGDFGWTLSVRDPQRGELDLRPTSTDFEYDIGGRQGHLIGKLRVPAAGRYTVRGTGPPDARVVFGEGLVGNLFRSVLGALASFIVLGAAGLVLIVRTAARRTPREQKRWP